MRCLMITGRPSFPPHDGGAIRAFNLLKGLNRNFDLDVMTLAPEDYDSHNLSQLECHCKNLMVVPSNASLSRDIYNIVQGSIWGVPMTMGRYNQQLFRKQLLERARSVDYDLVVLNSMHVSHYLDLFPNSLKVVDTQNNDITMYRRWASAQNNPLLKLFGVHQSHLATRFLKRMFPELDLIFAVSEKEEEEFGAFVPENRVATAPNGVDLEYFTCDKRDPDPNMILFSGAMHWIPNYDGAEYFLTEIFPLVKKRCPGARVVLAGKGPPEKLLSFAGEDVEFTGFVDDLRDYINKAAVSIVPLRIGGGTRLKIVEAMATKTPVVSTSIGAEGINCRDGEHLLIRDTPVSFASGVCEVLENQELRHQMTEKGYELVQAQYDWVSITEKMAQLIEQKAVEKKK